MTRYYSITKVIDIRVSETAVTEIKAGEFLVRSPSEIGMGEAIDAVAIFRRARGSVDTRPLLPPEP